MTENEIKNQIQLARTYISRTSMDFEEFSYVEGYIKALNVVLRLESEEYNKEDI